APVWSLFIGLWSLFGPWCLDLGTSPYSNFFTTAAAHWPASVYDTFTAYGFATGSGAPVCTRTGHSGSGVVWFGVPGSSPCLSASALAASSSSPDAAPVLPKCAFGAYTGTSGPNTAATARASQASRFGTPPAAAFTWSTSDGPTPASFSARRITVASTGPSRPRSNPDANPTSSARIGAPRFFANS